ncbi:MAG: DUF5995 family protein [Cyanobacteriota bacterium]
MKKYLLLSIFLVSSCTPSINTYTESFDVTNISSFSPVSIKNKKIGTFDNQALILSDLKGNSFDSEKKAIDFALNEQENSLPLNKKAYSIVNANNYFYVYEMKKNSLFFDAKDYKDLRNIKLESNLNFNLTAIISQKAKIRFYSSKKSNYLPSQAKSPQEIINRLKIMESDFSKTKDHRGVFVSTYRVISERVDKEIVKFRDQNKVKSADFLEKLMLNFANKYFYAHDLYFSDNFEKTPEVWKMAFDSGRKSENFGIEKSGNIVEILALSMNAHIIHDLAFSLKEVNYNPNDKELVAVYDMFNKALFEEKDNIIKSITNIYGKNIISSANSFFGVAGDFTMQKIFNLMRNVAKDQAELSNKEKIVSRSVSTGDLIMKSVLGGNSL